MLAATVVNLRERVRGLRRWAKRTFREARLGYHHKARWWTEQEWLPPYRAILERDAVNGFDFRRILDRRFQLIELAKAVRGLPGSTAECGVFRGVASALICQTLAGSYAAGEEHLGFDSFDGVAEPTEIDRRSNGRLHWRRGQMQASLAETSQFLAPFADCRLIQGWIPECFRGCEDRRFRLVHVDVDLHAATRDSLAFFYPRMAPGGIIVLDDHGFVDCPGARRAACEFFADKPEPIIEMPTGQGLVIKR
jgi:O-methyltransferase